MFLGGGSGNGGQYDDPKGLHWESHIDPTTNAMYHFNTRTGEAKGYNPEVEGRPLEPQAMEGRGEAATRRSVSADRSQHHATKTNNGSGTPIRVFEISSQLQLDQMKFKRRVYESKQREDDLRVEQQKYEDQTNERYLRASLVSSTEGEFAGMKERVLAAEQRKAIRVGKLKEKEEKKKREELEKEKKDKEKHLALLAKIEAGEKLTWTEMEDRKKHEREARVITRREELRAMSLGFEPSKGSDGRVRRRTIEKFYPNLYGEVQGSSRSTGEDPFKVSPSRLSLSPSLPPLGLSLPSLSTLGIALSPLFFALFPQLPLFPPRIFPHFSISFPLTSDLSFPLHSLTVPLPSLSPTPTHLSLPLPSLPPSHCLCLLVILSSTYHIIIFTRPYLLTS